MILESIRIIEHSQGWRSAVITGKAVTLSPTRNL